LKNEIITIHRNEADKIAEGYFIKMCGFDRDENKFKSMLQDGYGIREKLSDDLSVRAIISSFDKEIIWGKTVDINGVKFECNAFEQIDRENIKELFVYILTAGNFDLPGASMLEMVYADAWGTAYVDAGRDILRSRLSTREPFVSDSFGPGYYGMDVPQVKNFFRVLDSKKIDVKLLDSGLMVPVKSIAGLFVSVKDPSQLPGNDCSSCLANEKGCYFCRMKNKK